MIIREPYIGMPINIGDHGDLDCDTPAPGVPNTPDTPDTPTPGPTLPDLPSVPEMPSTPPAVTQPDSANGYNSRLLGSLPVAMAYVPMQVWKTTYSPAAALTQGTVFPELDLPFEGRMGV